jgi:hypothetical protein
LNSELKPYTSYKPDTSNKENIMAVSGRVQVLEEVTLPKERGWVLCLQWCRYVYDNGELEQGYRFIWRYPETGNLQGARGQARIPSLADARRLMAAAESEGWGDRRGEDAE